jgi:hypothetical protein
MTYLEEEMANFKRRVAEQPVLPKPGTTSSAGQPRTKTEDAAGRKPLKKTPGNGFF